VSRSCCQGRYPFGELNAEDLALVTSFIDALVTKTRLKVLASGR
jgi:hypothetical protein